MSYVCPLEYGSLKIVYEIVTYTLNVRFLNQQPQPKSPYHTFPCLSICDIKLYR